MDEEDLRYVLRRENLTMPKRRLREPDLFFKRRMIKVTFLYLHRISYFHFVLATLSLISPRLHYTEYLVEKINAHKLDPVSIFDEADLRVCLRRNGKTVPVRRWESEKLYRDKLIKVLTSALLPPLPAACNPYS